MKIDMLRFHSCSDKLQIIRSRWLLTFDNSFKTSAKGVWFYSVLIIASKCVKSRCYFLYIVAIISYYVHIYNNYWYEFGFYFWHLSFCFHEQTAKKDCDFISQYFALPHMAYFLFLCGCSVYIFNAYRHGNLGTWAHWLAWVEAWSLLPLMRLSCSNNKPISKILLTYNSHGTKHRQSSTNCTSLIDITLLVLFVFAMCCFVLVFFWERENNQIKKYIYTEGNFILLATHLVLIAWHDDIIFYLI
jgi:hypothetical protein